MMLTIWREGDVSEAAVVFPVEAPAESPAQNAAESRVPTAEASATEETPPA